MADENLTPQNQSAEGNTRRTLKLRPTTTNPAGSQLADPMHGETDTSNLDVLEDTQTRKTIKIKPLSPAAPQINIGKLQQTPGSTPLTGTQTRKSVVLKPQAQAGATPISGTQTRKAVVISPAANSTSTPISGTQTRKTVILKPTAKPTIAVSEPLDLNQAAAGQNNTAPVTQVIPEPAAPATQVIGDIDNTETQSAAVISASVPESAAPATQVIGDIDNTETQSAAVISASVPETEDSKTVKIIRPKRSTPADAPDLKRTVKLATIERTAPAAPVPAKAPEKDEQPETIVVAPSTINLGENEQPVIPQKEIAAKESAPETEAPVKESSQPTTQLPVTETLGTAAIPEPPKNLSQPADFDIAPVQEAPKASIFYSIVAVLTLALVVAASAFAAAQYLDYDHKINIYNYIPGLPHANK